MWDTERKKNITTFVFLSNSLQLMNTYLMIIIINTIFFHEE